MTSSNKRSTRLKVGDFPSIVYLREYQAYRQRRSEILQNVAKYEKSEATTDLNSEKDVVSYLSSINQPNQSPAPSNLIPQTQMIFCDNSNYEKPKKHTYNKVIGAPLTKDAAENVQLCYDPNQAPDTKLPMAITTSSGLFDYRQWQNLLQEQPSKHGAGPEPIRTLCTIPQPGKPNTMDLCTWYLNTLGKGGYTKLDDGTIAKVQTKTFIAGLKKNNKAVDALVHSLAGTVLHEVSYFDAGRL